MRGWAVASVALLLAACGGRAKTSAAPAQAAAVTVASDGPPKLDAEPAIAFPEPQAWTLSNGVAVWFVEGHRLPIVAARIVTRVGAGDPEGAAGVSAFMTAALAPVATSATVQMAFRGARSTTFVGWDVAGVALTSESSSFPVAFRALADSVVSPRFTAEGVTKAKVARRKGLVVVDADDAAQHAASVAMFGRKHPYGSSLTGAPSDLASFSVADMALAHRAAFRPDEMAVFVCGDARRADLEPLLERTLGKLPVSREKRREMPAATPGAHRFLLVDVPNAVRAAIHIADELPPESGDEAALLVLSEIVGGQQRGRLNAALRIAHGYTYGAHAAFTARRNASVLSIQTETSVESAPGAVRAVLAVIKKLASEGPTQEEIDRAKHRVVWSIYGSFETARDVTTAMQGTFARRLPPNEFASRVERVRALTKADLDAAARRLLRPSHVRVVVAADTNKLHRELDDLDLGEPVFRDVWGNEVR